MLAIDFPHIFYDGIQVKIVPPYIQVMFLSLEEPLGSHSVNRLSQQWIVSKVLGFLGHLAVLVSQEMRE